MNEHKSNKSIKIIVVNESLETVKFPVSISTIILYIFIFSAGLSLPFFFWSNDTTISIPFAIFCGLLVLYNIISFVMMFRRKLTIDLKNRILTYFSFFKTPFYINEIVSLDPKTFIDVEGPNLYFLLITTKNKKIKIKTQSEEQSHALKEKILSLIDLDRNDEKLDE